MKDICFLMTHGSSDWRLAKQILEQNLDTEVYHTGRQYGHCTDLAYLSSLPHKKNDSKSIWCDVLLFNEQLTCQQLAKHCRFIYLHLPYVESKEFTLPYYNWRLSGMKQYFCKTGGIWVDDLTKLYSSFLSAF